MWSHVIKHFLNIWVSRLCELRLCALSFFDFFPFSRRRLRYFVLSALDILVNMNASTVTFIEIWRYCPCYFNMLTSTTLNRSGWGGGVLPEKLGRGVWFASENPHPIYDQNMRYSLPYLWPEQKFETLFRPVSVVRYNTSLVQTNVKLLKT